MTSRKLLGSLVSALILSGFPSLPSYAGEVPQQTATVGTLRCEFLENPLGIDAAQPRLSWIQQSAGRGARQTAWQVRAASSPKLLESGMPDLWDSGKVESDQSIHVRYGGKPLTPRQHVFWQVRIWDEHGQVTDWSETAHWSMALDETDWQGRWIGVDTKPPQQPFAGTSWIGHPADAENAPPKATKRFFRRSFDLPADRTIQHGSFTLGVNGHFGCAVDARPVPGGNGWREVNVINITSRLKAGRNTVALWVETDDQSPSPEPALTGRIEIHFKSGEPLVINTDEAWKTSTTETAAWIHPDGDESAWQQARVIGPAGCEPWGGVFLPADRTLPARMLRKDFAAASPPVRAMLHASGQGISEFEINGVKVGDHVLSPALTEYDKRVAFVTHDVTDMIRAGENTIGAHLGNGRFHAPRINSPVKTSDFGTPRVLLQLELEHADGSRQIIASDESWKATDQGPIRANNEYDGEEYDARMEMPGWSAPGFDDSKWQAADVMEAPKGRLSAQMIHPIRVTETLKPVAMTEPSPGLFIFDMGQNMVGWCRIKVEGPRGTAVKLRHAETLRDDGQLYLANMRDAMVTDLYHLKGGGPETYEPRFTYHGFRYVEVTGFPGKPTLASIEGRVVHDDLPAAGDFECSEPLINRFHQNVRWGLRGNYRSIPTDCPQRDERQGWLGDRAFSSRGETFIFDTAAFYAKWLQDMADAQKESGSIPDVCPSYWPLFYTDNVSWPSAALVIPGAMLDQYADAALIARHYPAMAKWIGHMSGYIKDDLIDRDNYGDWCMPPEDPELIHSADPARKTDKTLIATAYFCHNLNLMSGYARMLGKEEEAKEFSARAKRMTDAFNRRFYNSKDGHYDNGTQTSSVLPLAFGLVPEKERPRVFEHLVGRITGDFDGHIGTGLIGMQCFNRVLTEGGRPDLIHLIATKTTYPGWGYMIENGATTVWELWNGNTADPAMNSGNHVMLVGDFIVWLYESLAGIQSDPLNPGFKHVIMKPETEAGFSFARASHHSPYGTIRSDWKKQDGAFHWNITIPPNSSATVHVPCKDAAKLLEGGKPLAESAGVTFKEHKNGRAILEISAGSYEFTSP